MALASTQMYHHLALLHRAPFLRTLIGTRRLASKMSVPALNSFTNGKTQDRSNLIPFSSRLREGRALAQDVWSIYKCVHTCTLGGSSTVLRWCSVLPIFLRIVSIWARATWTLHPQNGSRTLLMRPCVLWDPIITPTLRVAFAFGRQLKTSMGLPSGESSMSNLKYSWPVVPTKVRLMSCLFIGL